VAVFLAEAIAHKNRRKLPFELSATFPLAKEVLIARIIYSIRDEVTARSSV